MKILIQLYFLTGFRRAKHNTKMMSVIRRMFPSVSVEVVKIPCNIPDIENQLLNRYLKETDNNKKHQIWNDLVLHWEQEERKEISKFKWHL